MDFPKQQTLDAQWCKSSVYLLHIDSSHTYCSVENVSNTDNTPKLEIDLERKLQGPKIKNKDEIDGTVCAI
jgi:hypothetical protein